jgi:hypothetical protein
VRTFHAGLDLQRRPKPIQRFAHDPIQLGILMRRIVMKGDQRTHARTLRELDRLSERAVAPPETFAVLLVTILGIVNQEVRPLR